MYRLFATCLILVLGLGLASGGFASGKKQDPPTADKSKAKETKKKRSSEEKRKKKEAQEAVKKCNKLYKKNKLAEAVKCFKKGLESSPLHCDTLIGTGISYAKLGQGKSAAKYYELFVKHCPHDLRVRQVSKTLEQYNEFNKGK